MKQLDTRSRQALRAGIARDFAIVSRDGADGSCVGAVLRMRRGLSRVEGDLVLVVDGPPADALVQASVLDALVPVVAMPCAATGRFRRPQTQGRV